MSCKSCSKKAASDSIRDGLSLVIQKVGPIAKICYSGTDTSIEPSELLPDHPRIKPFDVAWYNHPQAMDEFTTCPYGMTGADVVITPNLPLPPPSLDNDLHLQTTLVVSHHQQSERDKYKNRPRTYIEEDDHGNKTVVKVPGHQIIRDINTENLLLYPFTVDPLGTLGPMANTLLHGDATLDDPKALSLPQDSLVAHTRANAPDSIRGILPKANDRWKRTNGDRWFAPAYQHILPGQWAQQVLHLNITSALATHLLRCSQPGKKKFKSRRRPYTRGQNSLHRDFARPEPRNNPTPVPHTPRTVHTQTRAPTSTLPNVVSPGTTA
jgi:hypothetical protein